jgi:heat shock protein HslJ
MIGPMNLSAIARRAVTAAALVVIVAACMPSSDAITGAWKLVGVNGSAPATEGALSLLPDGKLTMRPGCNSGGGTYTIEANRLVTDSLSLTMMSCGEAADAQEQAFLAVLDADPRFEVETGTARLRLTSGDSVLVFEGQ